MPESRVRSVLQSIFRVRLHDSSSSNSDVTNGNSSNDNDSTGQ